MNKSLIVNLAQTLYRFSNVNIEEEEKINCQDKRVFPLIILDFFILQLNVLSFLLLHSEASIKSETMDIK